MTFSTSYIVSYPEWFRSTQRRYFIWCDTPPGSSPRTHGAFVWLRFGGGTTQGGAGASYLTIDHHAIQRLSKPIHAGLYNIRWVKIYANPINRASRYTELNENNVCTLFFYNTTDLVKNILQKMTPLLCLREDRASALILHHDSARMADSPHAADWYKLIAMSPPHVVVASPAHGV